MKRKAPGHYKFVKFRPALGAPLHFNLRSIHWRIVQKECLQQFLQKNQTVQGDTSMHNLNSKETHKPFFTRTKSSFRVLCITRNSQISTETNRSILLPCPSIGSNRTWYEEHRTLQICLIPTCLRSTSPWPESEWFSRKYLLNKECLLINCYKECCAPTSAPQNS